MVVGLRDEKEEWQGSGPNKSEHCVEYGGGWSGKIPEPKIFCQGKCLVVRSGVSLAGAMVVLAEGQDGWVQDVVLRRCELGVPENSSQLHKPGMKRDGAWGSGRRPICSYGLASQQGGFVLPRGDNC